MEIRERGLVGSAERPDTASSGHENATMTRLFCVAVVGPGCWGPHGGNVSQQYVYLLLLP